MTVVVSMAPSNPKGVYRHNSRITDGFVISGSVTIVLSKPISFTILNGSMQYLRAEECAA